MTFSLHDRILKRELGARSPRTGINGFYGDRAWVSQLDIVNELGGHNGCVNALSWSKSGALLASGSDDQHVNIHAYQPHNSASPFKFSTTIDTGHTQNIFSVKFMPHSNDRTVITAAGDAEVRIFDIEHAGRTGGDVRSTHARRAHGMLSSGVQYLSESDTNARVYKSHTDRVKRIVTESSPHLFLTCSEDGEVRQWDLRQPSSVYPRPRNGRSWMFASSEDDRALAPPPLISYKKWRLDLNTISCSPSQPHYIALGGAHLHCFLHDRRMLGRDKAVEQGWGGAPSLARDLSDHDDELMGEATMCVRRFAPNGKSIMKRDDNGHITACKISDANPNELVVSWSQDYVYNFDMVQAPDARQMPPVATSLVVKKHARARQSSERKRKRTKDNSALSQEGSARASSRARRQSQTNGNDSDMSLRVRYENGQSEQIPIQNHESSDPNTAKRTRRVTTESSDSFRFAKTVHQIRKGLYSLQPAKEVTDQDPTGHATEMTGILGLAASILPDMDKKMVQWHYPVDPDEAEVAYQKTLKKHREAARRFVQASGVIARLSGGRLQTAQANEFLINRFTAITPSINESEIQDSSEQFCYDFIKAIVLWLNSGPTALVEGFTSRTPRPRFPVPKAAGIEAIEEVIIPYLLELAGNRSIPNLDASRFEVDDNRKIFGSEKTAVLSFASALKIPFEDLTTVAVMPASDSNASHERAIAAQDRKTALRFWGLKVGRGILKNVGDSEGVEARTLSRAFGGSGRIDVALRAEERAVVRQQEEVNPEEEEPVADAVGIVRRPRRSASITNGRTDRDSECEGEVEQQQESSDDIDMVSTENVGAALAEAGVLEEGDIEEIIDPGGSDRERGTSPNETDDSELEDDYDRALDDDEPGEREEDEDDDDDDDDESPMLFRLGYKRATLKEQVHVEVPCIPHIRQYRGHCNVKTVKDINFFGRNDEYIVSGSDCGHLFIWDRASSQLVNILKGDGEVVNVVQAHPYEPTLAVSGIDHTIKIFGPDHRARRDARKGVNLCNRDAADSSSSLRASRLGVRRSRHALVEERKNEEQAAPPLADSDVTNTEDEDESREGGNAVSRNREFIASNGLVSRRRMHHEYRITSQNDEERQAGNRSTFLTASLLAQLFAGAQMNQEDEENDDDDAGDEGGDDGNGSGGGQRDDDDDEGAAGGGGRRRGGRGIQIGLVNGRLTLRMA